MIIAVTGAEKRNLEKILKELLRDCMQGRSSENVIPSWNGIWMRDVIALILIWLCNVELDVINTLCDKWKHDDRVKHLLIYRFAAIVSALQNPWLIQFLPETTLPGNWMRWFAMVRLYIWHGCNLNILTLNKLY